MTVKNLGLVKAIHTGTTAPDNTAMLWFDTNVGVNIHKYYNLVSGQWVAFIINEATAPLVRGGDGTISISYDANHFETIGGVFKIKAGVLEAAVGPFAIADITGLQSSLDSKVDKVSGKSLIADSEITRLATVTNYSHPASHAPSIISQDANNRFVTDVEKASWSAKQDALGFTPYDASNPDGFITENQSAKRPAVITLPPAATVQQRCNAAIEGTDYPAGWTISAGYNPNDLAIYHNQNRYVANVNVGSINEISGQIRMLIGTAAYSGILEVDKSNLTIENLATVETEIVITIIFA
jgi:hypothetical protein